VIALVDDKFVDLDELVPENEITDEPVKKSKEQPQQKVQQQKTQQQSAPQSSLQENGEKIDKPAEKKEPVKDPVKETAKDAIKEIKTAQKPVQRPVQKIIRKSEVKQEQKTAKKTAAPVVRQVKKESKIEMQKASKPFVVSKKSEQKKIEKNSAKQPASKQSKPAKVQKSKGKSTNWVLISLLILAVIAIGVVAYFLLHAKSTPKDSVVALVNGQPIYKSEITSRYNLLSTTMNPLITKEQVLNMTITDTLLLQEAAKRGIITNDQEVTDVLQNVMKTNNIDDAALRADLKAKNITYEYIFKLYKDTLTINKFLNSTFLNSTVNEEDIQVFYEKNKEYLKVPDRVQVRHILIAFGNATSNITENETYVSAKAVKEKVNSDRSNFCDLVREYTADVASINTCGEYNFSKTDQLVPEFLSAGFSMKPGDVEIVKTQFGYHIMYKVADLKGYTPSLDSLRTQIEPLVKQQKALEEYQAFVDGLWNISSIETYDNGVLITKYGASLVSGEGDSGAAVNAVDQVNADNSNKTVNAVQGTAANEAPLETSQGVLAKCLTQKGAKVFVASWSPDVSAQLLLFGDAKSNLVVIECDPENPAANLPACSAVLTKQYPTWPTWQINGSLVEGYQSLIALAKESGCEYTP
jgi:peptidyl-prolyl cis-trans isomerase C